MIFIECSYFTSPWTLGHYSHPPHAWKVLYNSSTMLIAYFSVLLVTAPCPSLSIHIESSKRSKFNYEFDDISKAILPSSDMIFFKDIHRLCRVEMTWSLPGELARLSRNPKRFEISSFSSGQNEVYCSGINGFAKWKNRLNFTRPIFRNCLHFLDESSTLERCL